MLRKKEYRTCEEWNRLGFYVRRGEHAFLRAPVTGEPLFGEDQVEEKDDETKDYGVDVDEFCF